MRPAKRARTDAPARRAPSRTRVGRPSGCGRSARTIGNRRSPPTHRLRTSTRSRPDTRGPARCPSCPSPSIVLRVSRRRRKDVGTRPVPLSSARRSNTGSTTRRSWSMRTGRCSPHGSQGFQPGVSVLQSTDHGRTWTTPVSMPSAWSDKPWLAVSPSGRTSTSHTTDPATATASSASHTTEATSFVTKKVTDKNRYFFAGGGGYRRTASTSPSRESDYDQHSAAQIHSDVVLSDDGGATWR